MRMEELRNTHGFVEISASFDHRDGRESHAVMWSPVGVYVVRTSMDSEGEAVSLAFVPPQGETLDLAAFSTSRRITLPGGVYPPQTARTGDPFAGLDAMMAQAREVADKHLSLVGREGVLAIPH